MNDATDGNREKQPSRFGLVGIGAAIVGIVLVTIIVVGWHARRTNPSVARRLHSALPVEVATAERAPLVEVLGAPGEVRPATVVTLTAGWSMRVEDVEVDVGDTVSSGQTLVRYDPELSRTLMEAAQSRVDQTTAELTRAEERLKRVREIYKEGYSGHALKTATSTMQHAKGELDRAEENLQRVDKIYKQGLLAITDLEKAQATVQAARMRYDEAEANLLRVRSDPQGELEQAEADVHAAELARSRAQEERVRASRGMAVTSPVHGVILERLVNPGETPNSGRPLLSIGQIDRVHVEAKVAEGRVGDIRLGMPATVTFGAFPNDTFTGKVVRIRPESDPLTQSFLVYVEVQNPELRLKPGMSSFVRIEEPHDGLAVPSIALLNPTGVRESAVFVVGEDSHVTMRKVRIGAVGDGMTQIIEGLADGERVVVVGQYHLKDGDLVRIGDPT